MVAHPALAQVPDLQVLREFVIPPPMFKDSVLIFPLAHPLFHGFKDGAHRRIDIDADEGRDRHFVERWIA